MSMTGPRAPRRWWALAALGLISLTLGFDLTILNVALPTISADLRIGTDEQQWVVNAYLVVNAAAVLPGGLLGDRFGRRRTLLVGLGIVLLGSALGALAGGTAQLLAARALMGLGAGLIVPLTMALLPTFLPPADRPKALAVLATSFAAGMPVGPLVGGWLLDEFPWGALFLINLPVLGLAALGCRLLLPESSDPAAPRVNPLSTALLGLGIGSLLYAVIEGAERGWDRPLVLLTLCAPLPLLTWALLRESRRRRPMVDLRLLRDPAFGWPTLFSALASLILAGLLFFLPQYLQAVRGHDSFATGVRLLPLLAGLLLTVRGCGPLVRHFGTGAVVASGLVMLSFAGFLGSSVLADAGEGQLAIWLAITGLGLGLALVPATDAAMNALPPGRFGIGSGMLSTMRLLGAALGVALLGSLLAHSYRGGLRTEGLPPEAAEQAGRSVTAAHQWAETLNHPELAEAADAAFTHATSVALFVCGYLALLSGLLAAWLLARSTPASATGLSQAGLPHAEPDTGG
ncbi:DHA2 family efflux MFS transporter permease subunit [Streptomyces triticirhizae]|uniref:DHA2 family efflux MFS transporter permease subunit n=2 Tax=Streptomyces triticirhizae TaxID=2483353 RepID=A0A3M2LU33_9ACTN|nr:DHA2 family efflux MFS transporter permease subunit [Streptomyces triticirhizae]